MYAWAILGGKITFWQMIFFPFSFEKQLRSSFYLLQYVVPNIEYLKVY